MKALKLSVDYADGRAEAYNNLAFVSIARMDYERAAMLLDSVVQTTDNQIELLLADVQGMRLCQRTSRNKDFYDYNERARLRLQRVEEDGNTLSARLRQRFLYAKSEYAIVKSTYYYYVGLKKQSIEALDSISASELQQDTAQYLNYLYQIGSGGMVDGKNDYEICQQEFEYLLECYLLSCRGGYVYWTANSMQSLGEHLRDRKLCLWLTTNNPVTIKYLNSDDMPDSLLAGNLAQRSLAMFSTYGDKYQIAGAYRTLASCYWAIGDYTSSLICLKNALADKCIDQAPDLVASIREWLSLTYSALDDKAESDRNRNLYLDMQEQTRQDRQLEARAEQLERTSIQLNVMAGFILFLLLLVTVLIFVLRYVRINKDRGRYLDELLKPLRKWEKLNDQHLKELTERREEIEESLSVSRFHIENNKKRNVENRAKIFLANSVTPFIDRIINEAQRMADADEPQERRQERMEYIRELTEKINDCNTVLTSWIQLQQGQLGIKIESFPLQNVFDIVGRASVSFRLKNLTLVVEPTSAVVKADRTLTLFMLNTIADNSRKFTDNGGMVKIYATECKEYVEVSVEDNGRGMTEQELSSIFHRSLSDGHGFGLMNCRGIMEKYKKVSRVFSVCGLFAESVKGQGSRFFFRLPTGITHAICLLFIMAGLCQPVHGQQLNTASTEEKLSAETILKEADAYADSAYYSNVNGSYARTLDYAAAAIKRLNDYFKMTNSGSRRQMSFRDDGKETPAEIEWFRSSIEIDYNIILDLRNETAVAALALHDWPLYSYNNSVYTQLFKLKSADAGLAEYCRTMQRSSSNKAIAVVVLVLLLVSAVVAYYLIYYRHVLYFRFCADNVGNLNGILLSHADDAEKLRAVSNVDTSRYPEALRNIADTIRTALERSVDQSGKSLVDIELASDELRRADYEDSKLYVCNNVTDNCLSALKHETMYYPSRICQMVDSPDCDMNSLTEVAMYYRELCTILSRQAASISDGIRFDCRPVELRLSGGAEVSVMGDSVLIGYLFDIIRKQNGGVQPRLEEECRSGKYLVLRVLCGNVNLSAEQASNLFTPSVAAIPYLICRQIVRDMGEATNLHACGIVGEATPEGLVLRLTLACV